jgi:hypothetical protein
MNLFLRRSSLSLSACSSPRDEDDELFPTSVRAMERLHFILKHNSIRNFLISKKHLDATDEESLVTVPHFMLSGIKLFNVYSEATKTIIVFHDAAEECISDYYKGDTANGRFHNMLIAMGFNVVIVQYVCDTFSIVDMIDTTLPSLVRTLTQKYKPKDMIIMGKGKLGSILALETVSRFKKISAIILESPVAELYDIAVEDEILLRQIGTTDDLKEALSTYCSNTPKIESYKGKVMLLHSKLDTNIPMGHAEKLFEACGSNNKGLVVMEHGNHGNLFESNIFQYIHALQQFCEWIHHPIPSTFHPCHVELLEIYDASATEIATAFEQTPTETITDEDVFLLQ